MIITERAAYRTTRKEYTSKKGFLARILFKKRGSRKVKGRKQVKFSQGYPCLTAGYDVDLIAIVFLKSRGPRHNDFGLNSKVIFEQTKDAACQSRIFRRKMNAHFLP